MFGLKCKPFSSESVEMVDGEPEKCDTSFTVTEGEIQTPYYSVVLGKNNEINTLMCFFQFN